MQSPGPQRAGTLLAVLLVACSPADDVGQVKIALQQAPTDVNCLRITVSGGRTVVKVQPVTPGQATVFGLNGLPTGRATFSAEAFEAACSTAAASSVADWVSDPVQATVAVGVVAEVTLRMHRNGRASVGIDFDDPVGPDAGPPPDGPAPDAATPRPGSVAYVTDEGCTGTMYELDLATNTVAATIHLGEGPDEEASGFEVAFSPDGNRAYVSAVSGGFDRRTGELIVVDTPARSVVKRVPLPGYPFGVVVTPDGTKVYVTADLGEPFGDVNVVVAVDAATGTVLAEIPVGQLPRGLAVTPDGTRVYVTNARDGSVSVIDTARNTVVATVPLTLYEPISIAVTPDGTRALVSGAPRTAAERSVVPILDLASNTEIAAIPIGGIAQQLALGPDGARAYVTYNVPPAGLDAGHVAVIDTVMRSVVGDVVVEASPLGVAVTPDGARVYVANTFSDSVSVIDAANRTVLTTIRAPRLCAYGVAIR